VLHELYGLHLSAYSQLLTAPPGTQAACMDIQKAFRNSPVLPAHKHYIALHWRGGYPIDHVLPFGLATAGGIQGTVADAIVDILEAHGVHRIIKWVDDFGSFQEPSDSQTDDSHTTIYIYSYDLDMIMAITLPLGVPWHDVAVKGGVFAFLFEYVGFDWDLAVRSVALPEWKRIKYTKQVTLFFASLKSMLDACRKLLGTLQHITFVFTLGRSFLPALTRYITSFNNHRFATRSIPRDVRRDMEWWKHALSNKSLSRSILPRTSMDHDIWVDASTSWGVGLLVKGKWAAWKLADGWNGGGRDIGWAETIAVGIAAIWIANTSICDAHVCINSDNTGVIGALIRGRSHSVSRNESIRRITHILAPINVSIDS
jgi:hypothetical protein